MATLTERPIIKSIGEDTTNKNNPNQTAIGEAIDYGSLLSSAETNGFSYILSEAVKNLQRTGGMYSSVIPYSAGQSCSVLCKMGTQYGIRRFVCVSPTEITDVSPLPGAVITSVSGVPCYSGGILSSSWQDADMIDGFASTDIDIPYDGEIDLQTFAAVNVGTRQYVNAGYASWFGNPELKRYGIMLAPDIREILATINGLYMPAYEVMFLNVATYPLRRLGVYNFRGQKVEAFGMFLSGQAFSDNGTSNSSKFFRSLSINNPTLCVVDNAYSQGIFFSGTPGGTITPRDYRGRVQVCAGTATLSSGTSEARASLGGVQDDQVQGHWHEFWSDTIDRGSGAIRASSPIANGDYASRVKYGATQVQSAQSDNTHGTPRVGYNTREATFTGPVPMVVSLLPYGEITL